DHRDDQLDADLGHVVVLVERGHGLSDTHHDHAREQLDACAPEHDVVDAQVRQGHEVATDQGGHAQQVDQNEDVVKKRHARQSIGSTSVLDLHDPPGPPGAPGVTLAVNDRGPQTVTHRHSPSFRYRPAARLSHDVGHNTT